MPAQSDPKKMMAAGLSAMKAASESMTSSIRTNTISLQADVEKYSKCLREIEARCRGEAKTNLGARDLAEGLRLTGLELEPDNMDGEVHRLTDDVHRNMAVGVRIAGSYEKLANDVVRLRSELEAIAAEDMDAGILIGGAITRLIDELIHQMGPELGAQGHAV